MANPRPSVLWAQQQQQQQRVPLCVEFSEARWARCCHVWPRCQACSRWPAPWRTTSPRGASSSSSRSARARRTCHAARPLARAVRPARLAQDLPITVVAASSIGGPCEARRGAGSCIAHRDVLPDAPERSLGVRSPLGRGHVDGRPCPPPARSVLRTLSTAAPAGSAPPPPPQKTSFGNLKDEDRIFTNIYGRHDPFIQARAWPSSCSNSSSSAPRLPRGDNFARAAAPIP